MTGPRPSPGTAIRRRGAVSVSVAIMVMTLITTACSGNSDSTPITFGPPTSGSSPPATGTDAPEATPSTATTEPGLAADAVPLLAATLSSEASGAPSFRWEPAAGADRYVVAVRGPDEETLWIWVGRAEGVRYGDPPEPYDETEPDPEFLSVLGEGLPEALELARRSEASTERTEAVPPGSKGVVAAFDAEGTLIALSTVLQLP